MNFNSKIINILPHGSGIDYDWNIEHKAGKVICKNAYHRINQAGFYDGVFPFSVTFSHDDFSVKFHGLTSYGYKLVRWEGIRDYLEDTFALVFGDVLKAVEESSK